MKSIEHMSRNQRDKLRKRLKGKEDADEVASIKMVKLSAVYYVTQLLDKSNASRLPGKQTWLTAWLILLQVSAL